MRLGEVCLFSSDVIRLADFYKWLLGAENDSNDSVHQFILTEETSLTVYNDGNLRGANTQHIGIAFTVADVHAEYERLTARGVTVISPPTVRPWGATNMSFLDPDGNLVTVRSLAKA